MNENKVTEPVPLDLKPRATLADVAKSAGVSKMTVSRALRGASDVSKQNIEKVRQAAKEVGYVGNHLASSLSGQSSDLIGVVVPSVANRVFAEVLAGIAEGIEGSGMQPVFGVTDYDLEKEYDVIRNLLSWNPYGLIVTGLDQSEDSKRLLSNAQIPVVQIMDLDGTPIDSCVGFSHGAAGGEMADALIASGRSRFGYIGCNLKRDIRARKRLDGFKRVLARNGLTLVAQESLEDASTIEAGRLLTARVLSEQPQIDCIYYSNDDLAAGGAYHCIEAGISVPDRVSLVGFNGLDLVKNLPVPVATSSTPRRQIGRAASKIIVGQKNNSNTSASEIIELKVSIDLGS